MVSVPETEQCEALDIGQQVTLEVPPGDVLLSPPRWVSFLEYNCWPARVVLSANGGFDSLLVLKILGQKFDPHDDGQHVLAEPTASRVGSRDDSYSIECRLHQTALSRPFSSSSAPADRGYTTNPKRKCNAASMKQPCDRGRTFQRCRKMLE